MKGQWKMTTMDKIDEIFDIMKLYDIKNYYGKYYDSPYTTLSLDYEFGDLVSASINFAIDEYECHCSEELEIPVEVFNDLILMHEWFKTHFIAFENHNSQQIMLNAFKSMIKVKDIDFLYDAFECIKAGDTDRETIDNLIGKYAK